jgi:hypothetical protein
MKRFVFTVAAAIVVMTSIALSCKKEFSCEGCATDNNPPNDSLNDPPIACAGQDQLITLPANSVLLDGSCSSDPNNNITVYAWTKISGPALFSIVNETLVQTDVTDLEVGTYLFQLKVTDAGGLFSMDTMLVNVYVQPNNAAVDVYVAGNQNSQATYWKNGQAVTLRAAHPDSHATSIAVSGNDVYVAGWEGDDFMYGNNVAKYWKNGQEVLLTGPIGASATSIAVAGGDVYVAGWKFRGKKTVAVYWKNEQEVSLTDGLTDAEATCIVLAGSNLYVSGHEDGVAKYWENGQSVSLTDGSHQAYATSMVVVGSDVYVVGSEYNGSNFIVKYWKNGQAVSLTNGTTVYAVGQAMAVEGNDVYVAGWEGDMVGQVGGSGAVGKYWKNGQEVALTDGSSYGYMWGIALLNGDVYVCGAEFIDSWPTAKYWKNAPEGVVSLGTGGGASSILIVPR